MTEILERWQQAVSRRTLPGKHRERSSQPQDLQFSSEVSKMRACLSPVSPHFLVCDGDVCTPKRQ